LRDKHTQKNPIGILNNIINKKALWYRNVELLHNIQLFLHLPLDGYANYQFRYYYQNKKPFRGFPGYTGQIRTLSGLETGPQSYN